MIELEAITLKEYIELEDKSEYDFAMKYASVFTNKNDEYQIGDMKELSFGFIKDLQYEFETGAKFDQLIQLISSLGQLKKINLGAERLDKFSRFIAYIIEGLKEISEVERQTLMPVLDIDEEHANIDRFEGLGVYLQIRALTGGDITKFDHVRSLPYSLCFTELYAAKQLADYNRELTKIKMGKYG
jgi:hypothetical protein